MASAPGCVDLATVTAADFQSRRGEDFCLKSAAGEITLRLAEIRDVVQARRAGGGFSLTFVGVPGPYLPQSTYTIVNAAMGMVELFLVPIGPVADGNGYEAIFA